MKSQQLPRTGFTMIELIVVVIVVGLVTTYGATGLISQVPAMRAKSQAGILMTTLRTARERALTQQKTQKVRIYQTAAVSNVNELFREDSSGSWGTHQITLAAPVEAWVEPPTGPPTAYFSSNAFPSQLLSVPVPNYDTNPQMAPLMGAVNMTPGAANLTPFPRSMASIRLPNMIEMPNGVRIVAVNSFTTFRSTPIRYRDAPYTQPLPSTPNLLTAIGVPPRPPTFANADDRILDITYSPDGLFKFNPVQPTPNDLTLTVATLNGARMLEQALGASTQITPVALAQVLPGDYAIITVDRETGMAHY